MKDLKRLFVWSWEGWRARRPACIQLDMVLEAAMGEEERRLGRWSHAPCPHRHPLPMQRPLHHMALQRLTMPRKYTWMETSSIAILESPLRGAAFLFLSFKDMYADIQLTHVSWGPPGSWSL